RRYQMQGGLTEPTLRGAPCNLPCTARALPRTLVLRFGASTLDAGMLGRACQRLLFERFGREREGHRGPGTQAAGDLYRAAHGLHQPTSRVEANAASIRGQASGGLGPIELLEGPALRLLVHPRSFVSDLDHRRQLTSGRAIAGDV